ncbi:hypothetical protein MTP99_016089 [Tenebrio molitor]|jgi:hypothetical protein|nr:hypothetical protein MTP99_016089 [Tenebrio molitor]
MKTTLIKFKVTREETHPVSVPTSSGAFSGELLTPHLLAPRNSLSSVTGEWRRTGICRASRDANLTADSFSSCRMFDPEAATYHSPDHAPAESQSSGEEHLGASVDHRLGVALDQVGRRRCF